MPLRTDRPACDDCGRADGLDVDMLVKHWAAISGRTDGGGVLCLWCIDRRAAERGLSFEVFLHFAGRAVYAVGESSAESEASQ